MNVRGKKPSIAVVLSGINKEYQTGILGGIMAGVASYDYDLCIFTNMVESNRSLPNDVGENNIYNLLNVDLFDGVILLSNTIQVKDYSKKLIERVKNHNKPIVDIGTKIEGSYYIGIDDEKAIRAMVEHFIFHHGFTRLNYISGSPDNAESLIRLNTYKKVLIENNIPVEEDRIFYGNFIRRKGKAAVERFLSSSKEFPQAIICANDNMALGAFDALLQKGFSVPKDVALSGFDNITNAQQNSPKLTTVDRGLFNAGNLAVEKIYQHVKGIQTPIEELLDTRPIFTQSCGCDKDLIDDFDGFRRNHYIQVEKLSSFILQTNLMSVFLTGSTSLNDMVIRLRKYIPQLNCDKFYLCLCENWDDTNIVLSDESQAGRNGEYLIEGYTDKMIVPLAYEYGNFVQLPTFETKYVIPNNYSKDGSSDNYIMSPLHYNDRCFGYAVICNSSYPCESMLYSSWLMSISNALENIRKQDQLKCVVKTLDTLYVCDTMTGLYNRQGFNRHTADAYRLCTLEKRTILILYADLDGLKWINDNYGHEAGDIAIKTISDAFMQSCEDGEITARFGGDEFIIFGTDYDEEKINALYQRIKSRLALANSKIADFEVNASLGHLILVPDESVELNDYIKIADGRMYEQKCKRKSKRRKSLN